MIQKIPANTNLKIKTLMLKTMNLFPGSHFWRNRVMAFGNPICCPAVTYNLEKLKNFYFDEGMRLALTGMLGIRLVNTRDVLSMYLTSLCATGFMRSLKHQKPLQTTRVVKKIYTCTNSFGQNG